MITSIATIVLFTMAVFLPVLVPAVVSAYHWVAARSDRGDLSESSFPTGHRTAPVKMRAPELAFAAAID